MFGKGEVFVDSVKRRIWWKNGQLMENQHYPEGYMSTSKHSIAWRGSNSVRILLAPREL